MPKREDLYRAVISLDVVEEISNALEPDRPDTLTFGTDGNPGVRIEPDAVDGFVDISVERLGSLVAMTSPPGGGTINLANRAW